MADTSTIASLATAGGTLILAVATFSSTRSANRAARVSEEALMVGLRPVLFNARPEDPPQKIGFVDNHWVRVRDGLAVVQEHEGHVYMALGLRNVAQGLAVLHGWHVHAERITGDVAPPPVEDFRRHGRDLYVPAGDVSFWQAAVREPDDPLLGPLKAAIADGPGITVDLLYGDHEGGQRTITRFFLSPRMHGADEEPWMWMCSVSRHWNLDRDDPR
ncbi:MAG TPA: hypothetical protein VN618_10275 [Solirubrobacteraceae bacterium]|nr:hypothetical protein [Solirubrobacteraceae bacterium]